VELLPSPQELDALHTQAIRICCRRVELKQLTEAEYKDVILGGLVDDLNLDIADELLPYEHKIADLFWWHSGPDWKLIQDKLARPLDKELGQRSEKVRVVTREVLSKILGKHLPF